jgi:TPR repeat protein
MNKNSIINNNKKKFAVDVEWYKIRDTLFGENLVSQDISLALQLAASCQHPDARWLTEMCAGKDVTTVEDAEKCFLGPLNDEDARALCFAWSIRDAGEQDTADFAPMRRAAELGLAFAQAWMAVQSRGAERFRWAKLAAEQGERNGMYWLGFCCRNGEGCEKDLNRAKENFLLASELGDAWAMVRLGELFGDSDPQRWHWMGQAASRGIWWSFMGGFARQVELFESGAGSATVMFAIGRVLQGHVNEEARTVFEANGCAVGLAKQAISFYEAQIKATKDAMRAWTLVGIRWKVVKDVRKLIAKLIWDSREEALFSRFGL